MGPLLDAGALEVRWVRSWSHQLHQTQTPADQNALRIRPGLTYVASDLTRPDRRSEERPIIATSAFARCVSSRDSDFYTCPMADLDAVEARIWVLLAPYRDELEEATIYGMPSLRWPGSGSHDYFAAVKRSAHKVSL